MGLFDNTEDPPSPFVKEKGADSYLGMLEKNYTAQKKEELDIQRFAKKQPASGAVELDNTTMTAMMGVGIGMRFGQPFLASLADEVTMGGASLGKGLIKGLKRLSPIKIKTTNNPDADFIAFQTRLDRTKIANKEALIYHAKVNSPENIKKMEALDLENGNNNLIISLKNWNKKFTEHSADPLNISVRKLDPDDRLLGREPSGISGENRNPFNYRAHLEMNSGLSEEGIDRAVAIAQRHEDRFVHLNKTLDPSDYKHTVPHEGKHDRTGGNTLVSKSIKKDKDDAFWSDEEMTINNLNLNSSLTTNELDQLNTSYSYLTTDTEIDAYLGTNFKDELVEAGLIKNVTDDITTRKLYSLPLHAAIKELPTFRKYSGFIRNDKAFVKMVNKLAYSGTGVGIGLYNNSKK